MKILVIGGTGFISSNVVEMLVNEGHDVTILNRGKSTNNKSLNEKIKFIKADRHDKNKMTEAASNNFDVVILDDGFQDYTIKKDLNILCFNEKQLTGNGLTIPAGPLSCCFRVVRVVFVRRDATIIL